MVKRIALLLSFILIITGCSFTGDKDKDKDIAFGDVKTEYDFQTKPLDDALYSMMIEPSPKSTVKDAFLVSILEDSDAEWLGDDDWSSNYQIIEVDDGKTYATVKMTTTPGDLKGHFGVKTDEEVKELLIPQIFTTEDVYAGQKKAISDFGYKTLTDWQGTALGWKAFFVEFVDDDAKNHAMRFYVSNDVMGENHIGLTFNANIPIDRTELIDRYRKMILSISRA